jgi:N-acetylglutamate synthase-like GNAT family acetyltransferase
VNGEISFRKGRPGDLRATFGLCERAVADTGRRWPAGAPAEQTEAAIEAKWRLERSLVEFMAAQEGGCFWMAERDGELAAFARVVRFGRMEQLTEVCVAPEWQSRGLGRALLERCWPEPPTREVARLIVAGGSAADLSLTPGFGVMPATGHWRLVQSAQRYLEHRSQQVLDTAEAAVHVLKPDRAVAEWQRLEPLAIAHERPRLHEFFGRERICLASLDADGQANALCWVGSSGYIGPGVASDAGGLVPVVLAALDRVAKAEEPEALRVFCTTDSWWLLRRLRSLGFRVDWPGWILCSEPLPGLDRYVPTRPAYIL